MKGVWDHIGQSIGSGIIKRLGTPILGHSTVEMTKHYAKIVNEKLKADVLKFPTLGD